MLQIYFSTIKQYIKNKSNSKDKTLNDFNLETKLIGLFRSVLKK